LDFRAQVAESTHDGETTNLLELESSIPLPTITGASSALTCEWERKEMIVVVEDEAFVRKATGEALESAGYRVLAAENAAQAIKIRESSPLVDLLLTDIVMPGINGHQLANDFRLLYPDVRILLMSGYAAQLATPELSPYRKEYMAKPFSIPTLLKRVREVLDRNPFDFGVPV